MTMKRINRIPLLLLLLLPLASLAFASCDSEPASISIVQKGDYSELLEAIRSADKSLSAKLALIEDALNTGLADNRQAIQLVQEMLTAMGGTIEEKLAAIEEAMKAQTSALETKLALVEAAVRSGFADSGGQQALLRQALASLSGTLEEKLSAIKAAVESQAMALETKAALLEAAVQAGFADSAQAQALMAEAIDMMGKTAAEKLAAIEAAVNAQTTGLEAKLLLIQTAVGQGFADNAQQQELIQAALESLGGSMEEKLAAIESAMASQSSGLEMKIALIASALENGFEDGNQAIANMQTALDSSLSDLGTDLSSVKADILAQLQTLAGQLTATELSKAFQGVLDAIDSSQQSSEDILKSIQEAMDTITSVYGQGTPITALNYMGHPTERVTVSCGNDIIIKLRTGSSSDNLTTEMLQMDQQDRKQFFLVGTNRSQAVKNHFPSFAVAPDPDCKGQYVVSVKTLEDQMYPYWDESSLVFKVKTGEENGNPVYVSTQPIPVGIMPKPKDGLNIPGADNVASFLIRQGLNQTLGMIYQPLNSVVFTDESETRTYTAEFLESAVFDPTGNLKIKSSLDKEKRFVSFCPDATDTGWGSIMNPKDSAIVKHQEILGSLELVDKWGGSASQSLPSLKWYTSYADTVLASPTIASDGTLQANLASKATSLGLDLNEYPGSTYCFVRFDFASGGGAWMSAQFKPDSWDLGMQLLSYPAGSEFTVDAVVRQFVRPSETDALFLPMQRRALIRVRFTVK